MPNFAFCREKMRQEVVQKCPACLVGDGASANLSAQLSDVARKLVTGRVQSVALSHYEYNYPSGAMAAAIQMTKAGEKDFDEVRGEPSAGIPDFSTARAAWVFRHFLAAVMKFDFTVKALSKT